MACGLICVYRCDYAEIDCPYSFVAGGKVAPGCQRIPHALQSQGAREIVSAATGHHQHGKLQLDQLGKISVNGAVSAEDENRVSLARVAR